MQILKASRKKMKIRMALSGPAGSGKTYSALLIAYGIIGDWNRIVVIDTEHQSADLYANLGDYNVLSITAPFTPEKYIEAIAFCEKSEIGVIIIDSLSHCWEGIGGVLDIHSRMTGNSFTNWSKVTPRHNALMQSILNSNIHIIATLRKKQDYVLTNRDGKMVPEKVGLKSIQREGTDYEFTLVFDLDIHHYATASKDRTGLFMGKQEFMLTTEVGKQLIQWSEEGILPLPEKDDLNTILYRIHNSGTVEELLAIYKSNPTYQETLLADFTKKKQELQTPLHLLPTFQNQSSNGTSH